MKAKKSSGSTKGKSSDKRAVKDLTPREKHDVRGGTFSSTMSDVKKAWAAAAEPVKPPVDFSSLTGIL